MEETVSLFFFSRFPFLGCRFLPSLLSPLSPIPFMLYYFSLYWCSSSLPVSPSDSYNNFLACSLPSYFSHFSLDAYIKRSETDRHVHYLPFETYWGERGAFSACMYVRVRGAEQTSGRRYRKVMRGFCFMYLFRIWGSSCLFSFPFSLLHSYTYTHTHTHRASI